MTQKASKFVNKKYKGKIFYLKVEGETFYNILFKRYRLMTVNNLTVETLNPKNKLVYKH